MGAVIEVSVQIDVTASNTERGRYLLHYALRDCDDGTHVILCTHDVMPCASVVDVIRPHLDRLRVEIRGSRYDIARVWRTALLTWGCES